VLEEEEDDGLAYDDAPAAEGNPGDGEPLHCPLADISPSCYSMILMGFACSVLVIVFPGCRL